MVLNVVTHDIGSTHQYLQSARKHVLGTIENLDDEAMRRTVLPSGWTCMSMLNHLTYDVERFWFRAVMAAEPEMVAYYESGPADGWHVAPGTSPSSVVDGYRRAGELSDQIIAALPPSAAPRWWPGDQFGNWRLHDLNEVVLHVLVETATHAGHLDAAREMLDGRMWSVLD